MSKFVKLMFITIAVVLPAFFLGDIAHAATEHTCSPVQGYCQYGNLSSYPVKTTYNETTRQVEWSCGFGSIQTDCPADNNGSQAPSIFVTPVPVNPAPTSPAQSNDKKDQSQANNSFTYYYGEEQTITKEANRCACPVCGDKHYECKAGSKLGARAINKKEGDPNYDYKYYDSEGVLRQKTVWRWRCIDDCGNLTEECIEEKDENAKAKCDISNCSRADSCYQCAKCAVGKPVITSSTKSANGVGCNWYCDTGSPDDKYRDYCGAEVVGNSKICGMASGAILTEDPFISAVGVWKDNLVGDVKTNYIDRNGNSKYETIGFCGPNYGICEMTTYNRDENNKDGAYQMTWYCCPLPKKCAQYEKHSNQCVVCAATLENVPPTDFRHYNTTVGTGLIPGVGSTVGTSQVTVGRGMFTPSSWLY
jgi:hypothetical protein